VGDDVPMNSDVLLVNLKIKLTQSFRCAHRDRVCMRVFIWVSAHTYMSIYVCTVFLKKEQGELVRQSVSGKLWFFVGFYKRSVQPAMSAF
jgi:hypothetical protein